MTDYTQYSNFMHDPSGTPVSADTLNNGFYFGSLTTDTSPDGSANWWNVFTDNRATGFQVASTYNGTMTFMRGKSGNRWLAWNKQPTRSEVDTLNNSKAFVSWGTSLACTGPFGLLLINQNYNVVVRLASTSEIDVKVEYTNGTTHNAYTKHGTDNTVSFGATSSDSTCTITRSGTNFTVSVTGNSTIGWVAYSK